MKSISDFLVSCIKAIFSLILSLLKKIAMFFASNSPHDVLAKLFNMSAFSRAMIALAICALIFLLNMWKASGMMSE